mmetsp:Transcript_22423/g.44429  ORF Transcript_22423/g.44429 Transcript_22423/m.44429 type:complete len:96 (-) Transcript_22423:1704-1991(-)
MQLPAPCHNRHKHATHANALANAYTPISKRENERRREDEKSAGKEADWKPHPRMKGAHAHECRPSPPKITTELRDRTADTHRRFFAFRLTSESSK